MRAIIAMAALLCAPQLGFGQRTTGGGGEELRARTARTFDRADAFYGRAFESLREAAPVDTIPIAPLLQEAAVLRAAPGLERADAALLGRLAANLEKLRRVAPYLGSAGREAAGIPPGVSSARADDASGWPRVSAIVIQNVLDELRAPLSSSQLTAKGALAAATRAERLSMLGVLLPLYDEFLAVRSDLAARGGGGGDTGPTAAGPMSLGVTVSAHARSVVGVGAFAGGGRRGLLGGGRLLLDLDGDPKGGEVQGGGSMGDFIVLVGAQYLAVETDVRVFEERRDSVRVFDQQIESTVLTVTIRETEVLTTREVERAGATAAVLYARRAPLAFGVSFSTLQGFGVQLIYGMGRR